MNGSDIRSMLVAVADAMEANRDHLCALDGMIGDADHGIAMAGGFNAVRTALVALEQGGAPTLVFNTAAKAFLNAVGASSGPLYATALMRAGAVLKGKESWDDADAPGLIEAMAEGIAHRGKATVGDKTMLDAWAPAARAARAAKGQTAAQVFDAAAAAAEVGAEATKNMKAKLGRAARLGERSVGHIDPGAASAAILLRTWASVFG